MKPIKKIMEKRNRTIETYRGETSTELWLKREAQDLSWHEMIDILTETLQQVSQIF